MDAIIAAVISANALFMALIWIIVAGLVCWLLWWLIGAVGLPEPFNKVARVLIAVVAVIICINALLTLVGRPFITF
jgi:hypothetical protein